MDTHVYGIKEALGEVISNTGKSATELGEISGIGRTSIYAAKRATIIGERVCKVVEACGYRIAFVPKGSKLPNGSVLLQEQGFERSSGKKVGYVQRIGE